MNAASWEVLKKSDLTFSSQNWKREGMGSDEEEEEDALEWRRFWDGVDLRFGAIEQTNVRGREREGDNKKSTKQQIYQNI